MRQDGLVDADGALPELAGEAVGHRPPLDRQCTAHNRITVGALPGGRHVPLQAMIFLCRGCRFRSSPFVMRVRGRHHRRPARRENDHDAVPARRAQCRGGAPCRRRSRCSGRTRTWTRSTREIQSAGRLGVRRRPAAAVVGDGGPRPGRRGRHHRRPVRRDQGTARRLLDHRRCRPGHGAGLGRRGDRRPAPPPWRYGRSRRSRRPDRAGPDATAVERAYRDSSGRAVATLVRLFGDIDLAEEAVQEAFAVAAQRWPVAGVPPNPGGWIVTTARNKALDRLRRESSRYGREAQAALLRIQASPAEPPQRRWNQCLMTGCGSSSPAATRRWAPRRSSRSPCGSWPGCRPPRSPARSSTPEATDRAAAGPGQAEDPRREDPVPRAARRGADRPAAVRARRRLPGLQRGLHGLGGGRADPLRAVRRGDPAGPAAGRADAGRAGGPGPAGAAAADRGPPPGPHRRRRIPDPAGRPGSRPVGPGPDRRGPGPGARVPAPQPAGSLPAAGGDQRGARRRAGGRRSPTGGRSSRCTTSSP